MKYSELYRKLKKAGCFLLRHGGRHDIWSNPANGKSAVVPRHGTGEVPQGTLKSIKNLGFSPGSSSMRILVCEKNTFDYELITI